MYIDYEEENSILEMFWLDVEFVWCNCSSFFEVGNIGMKSFLNGNNLLVVNDFSEWELGNEVFYEDVNLLILYDFDNFDEMLVLFIEYFKLKGSMYYVYF